MDRHGRHLQPQPTAGKVIPEAVILPVLPTVPVPTKRPPESPQIRRQTEREIDRQTSRHMDRQSNRQRARQTKEKTKQKAERQEIKHRTLGLNVSSTDDVCIEEQLTAKKSITADAIKVEARGLVVRRSFVSWSQPQSAEIG
jgi:hypothetical protein